jgi:Secretion system C-terminal sorting domain
LTGTAALGQSKTGTQIPPAKLLKIYPNPATTVITIDFQKVNNSDFSLQIFNSIGKKVYENNNVSARTVVNLSQFYRGMYMYRLSDKRGQVVDSGKFQVAK